MERGKIKKVFPGGNTSKGFYSFYDYIASPDANKIFVIKGGPGVGKSNFMKHIGDELINLGYDVEFHCCSSDNNSLDGIYITKLDMAMIDGTAPHIVDPKNPGAVDEIIHLGDYWDEAKMRSNKEEIIACNREVGRLFRKAYAYLKAAKIFLDEVDTYYEDMQAVNYGLLYMKIEEIIAMILAGAKSTGKKGNERHLFATAITPNGAANYLETVVGELKKKIILTGGYRAGVAMVVKKAFEAVVLKGYDVEAYHCALTPDKIDHIVVPQLDAAIITSIEPHVYSNNGATLVDLDEFINFKKIEDYKENMGKAMLSYRNAFETAIEFIKNAKKIHDEMESYYIPNMDFEAINRKREEILNKILALTKEN